MFVCVCVVVHGLHDILFFTIGLIQGRDKTKNTSNDISFRQHVADHAGY